MATLLSDGNTVLLAGGLAISGTDAVSTGLVSSGLVARWESDAGVETDASGISAWVDQVSSRSAVRFDDEGPAQVVVSPGGTPALSIGERGGFRVETFSGLPTGAAARTTFLCFRPGSTGWYGGFGWGTQVANQSFVLGLDEDENFILDYLGGRVTGSASAGEWVVLTATYDGTTIRLYEDGTETASAVVALNTGNDKINIGMAFPPDLPTFGDYGAGLAYDRVLNSQEIAQNVAYLNGSYVNDITAPVLTSPALSGATSARLDWSVTSDEAGGTLYWLVNTSATTPEQATMASTGATVSVDTPGAQSGVAESLTPSTAYYLHAMQEDAAGNRSQVVTSASLATLAGDAAAPVLTSPTGSKNGQNGYTGSITVDEPCAVYRVVTTSATKPSFAQAFAGQDHSGATAAASGSDWIGAAGTLNVSGSGLAAGTTYYLHYHAADPSGNQTTTAATSASFTTDAAGSGTLQGPAVCGDWRYVPNIRDGDYSPPAHNKTANTGNLSSVISGLVAGDIVRLSDGDYGSVELYNIDMASETQFVAQNYGGATFGTLAMSECNNLSIRGVDAERLEVQRSDNFTLDYCTARRMITDVQARTAAFTYNGGRSSTRNSNMTVTNCIADAEWPDSSSGSKIHASLIGYADGFTIANCMFVRGNEDAWKMRGLRNGTVTETIAGWVRVDNGDKSTYDYHPDAVQSGPDSFSTLVNVTITFSAAISYVESGYSSGMGWFHKDGSHSNCVWEHCAAYPTLNSIGWAFYRSHSNSAVRNCSVIKGGFFIEGSSNEVSNCLGQNLFDTNAGFSFSGGVPQKSGNTWHSWDPITDVFTGSTGDDPANLRPVNASDAQKGCYQLLDLIDARAA